MYTCTCTSEYLYVSVERCLALAFFCVVCVILGPCHLSCLGSLVVESRVSWVRVPPETARFSLKKWCLAAESGVFVLCCDMCVIYWVVILAPTCMHSYIHRTVLTTR